MRHAPDDRHGRRVRAMIVILWRAGLRIQEALALAEHDLYQRRGSLLVRKGKGGRRREVGMDEWGWETVAAVARCTGRAAGGTAVLHHLRADPRANRGQAPPSARSSADSPFAPVSGARLRRKGCATARA
jgi:site-specific recombinase XerC